MNQVTKVTGAALTVLSVVALADGLVLADAASDYETLFGAEAKKVAASRTKTDDAKFAAKLLNAARKMPDSPALQVLLYEKACQFGSAHTAGCDIALEALGLLEKAIPAKKAQWLQRRLEVVKFRFERSYGPAKKAAGEPYMEMLEALADAKVAEGNGSEAKALYRRAVMVAKYIKSPRAAEIVAKSKRANAVVAQQTRLKSLKTRLKKNPQDTAVRKELVLLYVVGLDKPGEAARLLTDDIDEVTRTYVPLAARKLDDLDKAICLELGDWYYKKLSKDASLIGKPVVLRRAQGYYERFLELHTKKDAQSYRAEAALESIARELEKLRASGGPWGRTWTLNLGKGVTMKFVRIPAGKFTMGSPKTERNRRKDEGPQRSVTISNPFYMGVTEVTQAQYQAVMGKNPSTFKGPQHPVEMVSWDEATAFCTALSKKTGRVIRLPTEAQWEYACRAGSRTRYSSGNKDGDLGAQAWYIVNSDDKSHPVGRKKPNAWGLYDIHGNVWEWCADWHTDSYANAKTVDPKGPAAGKTRVFRGGSWGSDPHYCRAAVRGWGPRDRYDNTGFRVVVEAGRKLQPLPKSKFSSSGKRLTLNLGKGVTMKFTRIPAGKFLMGSPETEKDRSRDEGPQRRVTISKPFYMGVTEVTQAQYQAVMGENPSKFKGPRNPVEMVTWDEAVTFCTALSKKTRLTVRLPTEAEWEYACRAGSRTRYSFGDKDRDLGAYAWYLDNSDEKTHPVGRKKPNAWGLFDMHGNVWEYCADWYGGSYADAKTVDPKGPAAGKERVVRGGAIAERPGGPRSARRGDQHPDVRNPRAGFRVVVESGSGVD